MPLACGQFKERILELKEELEKARVLLGEYQQSGQGEKAEEAQSILKNFQKNYDIVFDDFKKSVTQLLQNWYSEDKLGQEWIFDDIAQTINFDTNGRVLLSGGLIMRNSAFDYFPKIIKKIRLANLIGNSRLRILPCLEECGNLQAGQGSGLQSLPMLVIAGELFLDGAKIKTLENLKETRYLSLPRDFASAPKLEKTGTILAVGRTKIDNFRAAFPVLSYVGGNLVLPSLKVKNQVEELIKNRELKVDGEITYR